MLFRGLICGFILVGRQQDEPRGIDECRRRRAAADEPAGIEAQREDHVIAVEEGSGRASVARS